MTVSLESGLSVPDDTVGRKRKMRVLYKSVKEGAASLLECALKRFVAMTIELVTWKVGNVTSFTLM